MGQTGSSNKDDTLHQLGRPQIEIPLSDNYMATLNMTTCLDTCKSTKRDTTVKQIQGC